MTPTEPSAPALDNSVTTPPPAASTGAAAMDLLAEPAFEECHAEWVRYHEDAKAGRISFVGIPEGHHVAYYAGSIVDHDTDCVALRDRVAAALGVHCARIVVSYPWMW